MGHYFGDVPVLSTSGQGRSFGVVELFVDPASHKVLTDRTRLQAAIPVCAQVEEKSGSCDPRKLKEPCAGVRLVAPTFLGGTVVADPAVEALVASALARVEEEQRRPLGVTVTAPLGHNYEAESALGDVLTDALREMEKVDVALLNSGGLRANAPRAHRPGPRPRADPPGRAGGLVEGPRHADRGARYRPHQPRGGRRVRLQEPRGPALRAALTTGRTPRAGRKIGSRAAGRFAGAHASGRDPGRSPPGPENRPGISFQLPVSSLL
jgi:hypothetical protein